MGCGVGLGPRWPSSVAGRKILDQYGDVYLMRTFSSWSLTDLSDASITTALEGVAGRGFNAVTVWAGGGYSINSSWEPRYVRKANGDAWWSGVPWESGLGPAWSAMDRVVSEAKRLGLTVNFSFCGGVGDQCARSDWEAASNAHMRAVGIAVATRYPVATYPNIVWHVMLDSPDTPGSTEGQRVEALFGGINDTEGASTRPVRWMEPTIGASIVGQGWLDAPEFRATMNGWYEYGSDSAQIAETSSSTRRSSGPCHSWW